MRADRTVAETFYNAAPRVFEVGDCIKPGRVVDAVTNGYYRALISNISETVSDNFNF